MTSRDTEGRPSGWRLFHFQYGRNPLRCQAMTVSGLTMTNADRQPLQNGASHAHRNRSARLKRSRWPRLERQELMSEGKNLSLQRCTSLKDLRAEENSERMIVSMSPKSYSDGRLSSSSSVRTEFLVGTRCKRAHARPGRVMARRVHHSQ